VRTVVRSMDGDRNHERTKREETPALKKVQKELRKKTLFERILDLTPGSNVLAEKNGVKERREETLTLGKVRDAVENTQKKKKQQDWGGCPGSERIPLPCLPGKVTEEPEVSARVRWLPAPGGEGGVPPLGTIKNSTNSN